MSVGAAPVEQWPLRTRVTLVDAWFRNPIEVKITMHPNADHIVAEDDRGIVYYAHHKRITGIVAQAERHRPSFDDLLGDGEKAAFDFDDLL